MMPRMIALMLLPLLMAAAADDDHRAPFDFRKSPAFGDARGPIRVFLAGAVPRPRGPQHFCVVGYRYDADNEIAYVHWREGNALIQWFGSADPAYLDESIADSRHQIDLNQDVVPTPADIGSSTYLVDKPWVDRILADCEARGIRYVVTAPPRKREGGE